MAKQSRNNRHAQSKRKQRIHTDSMAHRESRHEMEEYGKGKKDIIMCSKCNAVYYYKSWHHNLRSYDELSVDKQVSFTLCPACEMWHEHHQWEGEIQISGVPQKFQEQVVNTVWSTADEAFRRDPMDRVFEVKNRNGNITIYTSENQLANRIARKLASSLKNHFSKPQLHHGDQGDVFLLTMEWIGK